MLEIQVNQATESKRRVYFHLVSATDGMTPATSEAGGQPQISSDAGSWADTGIGVLTAIGNGRYYASLSQTAVSTVGTHIETRYKSANTAECPGDSVQVVSYDPDSLNSQTAGAGAITYRVVVTKPNDTAVLQGCELWVSTDVDGANIVAGTVTTDSNGSATFYLDAGDYYFWRQHVDYSFDTNPTLLTVS